MFILFICTNLFCENEKKEEIKAVVKKDIIKDLIKALKKNEFIECYSNRANAGSIIKYASFLGIFQAKFSAHEKEITKLFADKKKDDGDDFKDDELEAFKKINLDHSKFHLQYGALIDGKTLIELFNAGNSSAQERYKAYKKIQEILKNFLEKLIRFKIIRAKIAKHKQFYEERKKDLEEFKAKKELGAMALHEIEQKELQLQQLALEEEKLKFALQNYIQEVNLLELKDSDLEVMNFELDEFLVQMKESINEIKLDKSEYSCETLEAVAKRKKASVSKWLHLLEIFKLSYGKKDGYIKKNKIREELKNIFEFKDWSWSFELELNPNILTSFYVKAKDARLASMEANYAIRKNIIENETLLKELRILLKELEIERKMIQNEEDLFKNSQALYEKGFFEYSKLAELREKLSSKWQSYYEKCEKIIERYFKFLNVSGKLIKELESKV